MSIMRKTFLPFSRPTIDDEMINEVVDTLRSGWITTGPKVEQFEYDISVYVGKKNVVSLTSATAALHLVIHLLELKEGDEVITPSMTWPSAVNMIELQGGVPVFVDVDPDTLNISVEDLKNKISNKTRAIIPVHFAGQPVDIDAIYDVIDGKNIIIIEDAAHALGSYYKGKHVGEISDFTIYSFHPNKNITTGEGGIVVCKDPDMAEKIRILKFHGLERNAWSRFSKETKNVQYEVVQPGYKYNMMDIQAALGIHQLNRLDEFIERRTQLAESYNEFFKNMDFIEPLVKVDYDCKHAWHLYVIKIDIDKLKISRDEFMSRLKDLNVGSGLHYTPVHLHKYFREKYGHKRGDLPNTKYCGDRILSLPLFPEMTNKDQSDVVEAIKLIIGQCL